MESGEEIRRKLQRELDSTLQRERQKEEEKERVERQRERLREEIEDMTLALQRERQNCTALEKRQKKFDQVRSSSVYSHESCRNVTEFINLNLMSNLSSLILHSVSGRGESSERSPGRGEGQSRSRQPRKRNQVSGAVPSSAGKVISIT